MLKKQPEDTAWEKTEIAHSHPDNPYGSPSGDEREKPKLRLAAGGERNFPPQLLVAMFTNQLRTKGPQKKTNIPGQTYSISKGK